MLVSLLKEKPMRFTLFSFATFSFFCISIWAWRWSLSGNTRFAFLIWNLFLAWIPFGISIVMRGIDFQFKKNILGFLGLGIIWLLFLPNTAYIITDLLHLKARSDMPMWFDMLLIVAFALHGLFLGVTSIYFVHTKVEKLVGKALGWMLASASFALCGYGIYLGRFLRWNSWDLFLQPQLLLADVLDFILHPMTHPRTLGITISLALILFASYLFFHVAVEFGKAKQNLGD